MRRSSPSPRLAPIHYRCVTVTRHAVEAGLQASHYRYITVTLPLQVDGFKPEVDGPQGLACLSAMQLPIWGGEGEGAKRAVLGVLQLLNRQRGTLKLSVLAPPLGSALARLPQSCLLGARLAAPCSAALPR